ncbi:hypothetical protein [Rivibacter subsaxonicus]|uniref:hypothetical protein n=1 Tax=Rivibacter subsaxonicus TaxID=457575 RepID=UPI0013EE6844|nr:hypothetical protein [Rivibacter subsaxonicus]
MARFAHGFYNYFADASFYLNLVCELRLFVAEYKGEHLRTVPREIEKARVG